MFSSYLNGDGHVPVDFPQFRNSMLASAFPRDGLVIKRFSTSRDADWQLVSPRAFVEPFAHHLTYELAVQRPASC